MSAVSIVTTLVCVRVCDDALTAIIDVSGNVDSRVVVVSQTFKRGVLLKVWSNPVLSSLCLICIQLKGEKKIQSTIYGCSHYRFKKS